MARHDYQGPSASASAQRRQARLDRRLAFSARHPSIGFGIAFVSVGGLTALELSKAIAARAAVSHDWGLGFGCGIAAGIVVASLFVGVPKVTGRYSPWHKALSAGTGLFVVWTVYSTLGAFGFYRIRSPFQVGELACASTLFVTLLGVVVWAGYRVVAANARRRGASATD